MSWFPPISVFIQRNNKYLDISTDKTNPAKPVVQAHFQPLQLNEGISTSVFIISRLHGLDRIYHKLGKLN